MRIIKKISCAEYLYSLMEFNIADIELLPIFQGHYSRLLDPNIVSIRLNDSGILINRKLISDSPDGEPLFSQEQYGHFFNDRNLSSKEIYDSFIYDSNKEKLADIPYLIQNLPSYVMDEWNLFGDFPLAYSIYRTYCHSNDNEKELEQKLDQLHESVNDIIRISYRFSDYLMNSCADKSIELIRKQITEDPVLLRHYESYQTEATPRHSFEDEIYRCCLEIVEDLSDIEKKAIEYHLTDMSRVDVRQSGHYNFYINDSDAISSFIHNLSSIVTYRINQESLQFAS